MARLLRIERCSECPHCQYGDGEYLCDHPHHLGGDHVLERMKGPSRVFIYKEVDEALCPLEKAK